MENFIKRISMPAVNQQTPVGGGRWFQWIRRWNGDKTDGKERADSTDEKECGDNNSGYAIDAPETGATKEEVRTLERY